MIRRLFFTFAILLTFSASSAAEALKPFVLAYSNSDSMESAVAGLKKRIGAAGFQIVGDYYPYENAAVIAFTNDALKQAASKSEMGGFGAALRASVTRMDGRSQIAYTNPRYLALAYRFNADLSAMEKVLAKHIGNEQAFGPEQGLTPDELEDYNYMMGMEAFDDPIQLTLHRDHATAVKTVEDNLAKQVAGVSKVYRIDIPGKDEVVFGVAMNEAKGGTQDMDDAYIMSEIDFKPIRSTAHLPYEILVSGRFVYTLSARFRIAINFPDLAMVGDNSFMNIMQAPTAIKTALTQVAGGDVEKNFWE